MLLSDLGAELPVPLLPPETLISEVTLVTPWVLRASAIARPTASGLSAEPVSIISPVLASAWMLAWESWLSAWILPETIVLRTVSSVVPVGAPAVASFVRTMATPLSRSLLSSDGLKRHSVIRAEISSLAPALLAVAERLVSVEEVPVVPATDDDGEVAFAAEVVSVEVALPVVPVPATLLDGLVVSVVEEPVADAPVDVEP